MAVRVTGGCSSSGILSSPLCGPCLALVLTPSTQAFRELRQRWEISFVGKFRKFPAASGPTSCGRSSAFPRVWIPRPPSSPPRASWGPVSPGPWEAAGGGSGGQDKEPDLLPSKLPRSAWAGSDQTQPALQASLGPSPLPGPGTPPQPEPD